MLVNIVITVIVTQTFSLSVRLIVRFCYLSPSQWLVHTPTGHLNPVCDPKCHVTQCFFQCFRITLRLAGSWTFWRQPTKPSMPATTPFYTAIYTSRPVIPRSQLFMCKLWWPPSCRCDGLTQEGCFQNGRYVLVFYFTQFKFPILFFLWESDVFQWVTSKIHHPILMDVST
jgi:hypothetical protein